jgi:REP element-mobilizing transposase RayT
VNFQKRRRLANYDYKTSASYFITICTIQRLNCFWKKDVFQNTDAIELTEQGFCVKNAIETIEQAYPCVFLDHYTIMPNHIHLLLTLNDSETSVSSIINQTKGKITRQSGYSVFQKSFYDHIIRTPAEFERVWDYIENNPRKWNEDMYYLQ